MVLIEVQLTKQYTLSYDIPPHTLDPASPIDELYHTVTVKLVHSILTKSGGGHFHEEDKEDKMKEEKWVSAVLCKLQSNAFSLYHSNQQIIGCAVHIL